MSSVNKIFRNVRIIWPNFSGKVGEYNTTGERYFNIVLTDEMVKELQNLELVGDNGMILKGCNIRPHAPRNEGDPILYTLKIKFGNVAPDKIWRIVPKGRMQLNIDTVGNLDHERIDHADMKVTFATYNRAGNRGITAYLKNLHAYILEDDFDDDENFARIPIIGGGGEQVNNYSEETDDDLPF